MARPIKNIPIDDIKGLKTLLKEGNSQRDMAIYYNTSQATISRKLKEMPEDV